MEMICHMNYYWQKDKKQNKEMLLITMSTDLKLSKAQISKIVYTGGFSGSL